jgi:hypothetical protein
MGAEWRERATKEEVAAALGIPVEELVMVIPAPGCVYGVVQDNSSGKYWATPLVRGADSKLTISGKRLDVTDFMRLVGYP